MFQKLGLKSTILVGAFSAVACGGVCGDGVIDAENDFGLAEACDDGNAAAGDGCNATCGAVEDGFDCPTAGAACVPTCGNGALDAGEECDGAVFDPAVNCEAFLATGTPTCQADCTATGDSCVAVAGDGIRTTELLVEGQGEECDDGNLVAGDGCAPDMTLEGLTTFVQVDANNQMNGTDPNDAIFSVFGTIGGVDFDGDGVDDGGFDFDGDTVAETSLLVVFSTDQRDICDQILVAGGFNDFLQNVLFAGLEPGTVALTMAQIPGDQGWAVGDITNNTACTLPPSATTGFFTDETAGTTAVEVGYVFQDVSDTTFGGDCTGTFTVDTFNFNDATLAGNISFTTTNTAQSTQFLPAVAAIDVPITADITAVACNLEILQ
jgi:cysteine-rich repeat protein